MYFKKYRVGYFGSMQGMYICKVGKETVIRIKNNPKKSNINVIKALQ